MSAEVESDVASKQCTWCHQHKPLDEFGNNPQNRDGLKSLCRPCSTEAVRRSRQRHGHDRDRARQLAERRAAAWVRGHHPNVWVGFLTEAENELGISRAPWERTETEASQR